MGIKWSALPPTSFLAPASLTCFDFAGVSSRISVLDLTDVLNTTYQSGFANPNAPLMTPVNVQTGNIYYQTTLGSVGNVWFWSRNTQNWAIISGLFTSANAVLTATNLINVAHGFPATPSKVRAVLVCTTNDAASGYLVGDEVECCYFFDPNNVIQPFSVKANATNVSLASNIIPVGNEISFQVIPNGGGPAVQVTSLNNFRAKIYASP